MNHKQFWTVLAAYYRTKIDDTTAQLYADDVASLTILELQAMFEKYRRDPGNKFMPMPSWFLEKKNPVTMDPKIQAREVASRLHSAVIKFGWPNPEQARAYIGEVGWAIAQRYGNWRQLCEHLGVEIDPGQFMAQTRDLAESMIRNNENGFLDKPIHFIESSKDYVDRKWDEFLDGRQKQLEAPSELKKIQSETLTEMLASLGKRES